MSELMNFDFDGKQVRSLLIDNEPWFVGKDVASVLEYTNPQKAIRDHIDVEDRTVNDSFTVNGTAPILINESGLYALIFGSKMPRAKEFKHWVTSVVLPQIRKTGSFNANERNTTIDNVMITLTETIKAMSEYIMNNNCMNANQNMNTYENKNHSFKQKGECKIETFPQELKEEVDEMFKSMISKGELNLSYIARYCTLKGYTITPPAVTRYYNKYFKDKDKEKGEKTK